MKSFDIFIFLFIAYGIYCAINLKKDSAEYQKTKHYVDRNIYIRNIGVVVGSVIMFFYELSQILS